MQAIRLPGVSPQPNRPSMMPWMNWISANRKETVRPDLMPRRMENRTIGSIDSSVMLPPQGSLTTRMKLRTVASATMIAPSTRILVLVLCIKKSSFVLSGGITSGCLYTGNSLSASLRRYYPVQVIRVRKDYSKRVPFCLSDVLP